MLVKVSTKIIFERKYSKGILILISILIAITMRKMKFEYDRGNKHEFNYDYLLEGCKKFEDIMNCGRC